MSLVPDIASPAIFGDSEPLLGEYIIRVVVVIVLAGLIGIEREFRDKPAGFRTIILIALGACVFSILSQALSGPGVDKGRIAAQIVTGVGFLGAGAIIRDQRGVFGLTTAATIWSVAAVGMAVGLGHILLGALAAVGIVTTLFLFDIFERIIGRYRDIQDYVVATPNTPGGFARVNALFKQARLRSKFRRSYEDGDALVIEFSAIGSKASHAKLREQVATAKDFVLRKA